MRLAFFLLVLANLVFFTWAQGYWGGQEEGREPQRLKDQLYPERMTAVPTVLPAAPLQACRRIDGLAAADAEQLRQKLQEGGFTASLQPGGEAPNYWVNIPALPGKAVADKKASELRLFGITDFHVMQTDGGNFAISLGVFRDENNANEFLRNLSKKGVKSARAELRPVPTARIEVRGAAEALTERLAELLVGAAGAVASDCP